MGAGCGKEALDIGFVVGEEIEYGPMGVVVEGGAEAEAHHPGSARLLRGRSRLPREGHHPLLLGVELSVGGYPPLSGALSLPQPDPQPNEQKCRHKPPYHLPVSGHFPLASRSYL